MSTAVALAMSARCVLDPRPAASGVKARSSAAPLSKLRRRLGRLAVIPRASEDGDAPEPGGDKKPFDPKTTNEERIRSIKGGPPTEGGDPEKP